MALLVAEDRMHERAATLFESVSREHWSLVTTNAVIVETIQFFWLALEMVGVSPSPFSMPCKSP